MKLLQKHSPDSLDTHVLSFEVNMRKQKILLAFQVCNTFKMQDLGPLLFFRIIALAVVHENYLVLLSNLFGQNNCFSCDLNLLLIYPFSQFS